ncbi:MAG: metallophosphoesterase family protein [Lentisphaeria bacterium]|jgi:diadenosine tetraphosphatase ApaH/serine/threonine PP2A family protein phosphatase
MKYAIVGDIHANLEALQVVLRRCQELAVERYLCIGDIVGYNANPAECVKIIRDLGPEVIVKGNHDEQAACHDELNGFNPQAAHAIDWTRHQLSEGDRAWLGSLPLQRTLGTKMTLVHATLDMPEKWGYVFESLTAEASLHYQFTQVCFFGHTHVPLVFEKFGRLSSEKYEDLKLLPGHKYMINVGSVGQPRDGDTRAAFATFDTDEMRVQLHRVEYDIAAAQEKILAADLPEKLAHRLSLGR